MRLAVIGARSHRSLAQVWRRVHELPACTVVSGGAISVDAVAAMAARQRGLEVEEHLPDYKAHGDRAPLVRNTTIATTVDRLEAFPWPGCRGTHHAIGEARKTGVPVTVHEPEAPALLVFTATMAYRGHHAFDISRKSGGPRGDPFAPSWSILKPAIDARRVAKEMRTEGKLELAAETEEEAWRDYVPKFMDLMRLSYRTNRPAWDALLATNAVVIQCYCASRETCHRGLLAGILTKLGAVDAGEVAPLKQRQMALIQ